MGRANGCINRRRWNDGYPFFASILAMAARAASAVHSFGESRNPRSFGNASFAVGPNAKDNLVAGLPLLDHVGDDFRRVLKVSGEEEDDGVAPRGHDTVEK